MSSINERMFDFQVAQQIRWIRLGNREVREALRVLARVDVELRALLAATDPQGAPFTVARLEALKVQVTNLINAVHGQLTPVLLDNANQAGILSAETEQQLLTRILPAGLDVVTPNLGVLQVAATLRPFNGAVLGDWINDLRMADLDRTWKAILDGITSGTTTDDLIRQIMGTSSLNYKDGVRQVTRRGLEALVRTSINHAANQGRQMVWEANQDIIKGVRWVSTLDTRTTPVCRERDGRVGPVVMTDGWEPPDGSLALEPPLARPPAHPNCRSTTVAITKSWQELGFDVPDLSPATRASMDGKVPADTTYFDWLNRQSSDIQKEVLGPSRYKLWKEGGITPDRFQNDAGRYFTLDELREKTPEAFKRAGL